MAFCVKVLHAKSLPIIKVASVVNFHWIHIPSWPNSGLVESSKWTKRALDVMTCYGWNMIFWSRSKILDLDQEQF